MKNIAIILSFFILFCCISCAPVDNYEEYEVSPHEAYIVSISDNRPAEIVIGWTHYAYNGCNGASGVSAERKPGNKIYLTIKDEIYTGPDDCADSEEPIFGKFTVKNLEVGEYIITGIHGNTEFARLRIEQDAAYSSIGFVYEGSHFFPTDPFFRIDPIISNNEDTYSVTVTLTLYGYYSIDCEPIIKTNIERTQDVIKIDAWQLISKTDCKIMPDPSDTTAQHERKSIDIDLGTFSTGSYTVFIGSNWYRLDIPPPPDRY